MEVKKWELWVTKANRFLGTPLGMFGAFVIVLLLVTAFFIYRGVESQRNLQPTLDQVHLTAIDAKNSANDAKDASDNTNIIIDKELPLIRKQISRMAEQNRCLLIAHGITGAISEEEQIRCDLVVQELEDDIVDGTSEETTQSGGNQNQVGGNQNNQGNSSSNGSNNGGSNGDAEQPSFVDQATKSVTDFIDDVVQGADNLVQGLLNIGDNNG
jgi:hypothetical protein